MRKQIENYNRMIAEIMEANRPDEDWRRLANDYLIKIQFYQHERLIHLIVTVLFALMEAIVIVGSVFSEGIGLFVLAIVILILLVPYIGHYYFLENTTQKMYLTYDEICKRIK